MPIDIHGKSYLTVAERLEMLRADHPDWSVTAQIVADDGERIVIRAEVADEAGRVRGTGHAEEVRGSTPINRTSACENCETSAWGRALSACGYAGSEVASADELVQALAQQSAAPSPPAAPRPASRPDPITAAGAPAWISEKLGFGKFAGETWCDVLEQDPSYLHFLAEKMDPKTEKMRTAQQRAKQLLDLREARMTAGGSDDIPF